MKKESKVTIRQIIAEYIKGMKGYKPIFVLTLIFYIIANIINVFTPYLYKDIFNILGSSGV